MHIKKHLSFKSLIKAFSNRVIGLSDKRSANRSQYTVHDVLLSGLACMYLQCPSLLSFQRELEKRRKQNNLQTQFHINSTPKDSQMKIVLDEIPRETFDPIFKEYLTRLQRSHQLSKFIFEEGAYLSLLDGTQYHSSETIHCEHCLTQTKKNGKVHYSHKVVQLVIAHPDLKQVIPMRPEEIRNEDGQSKQDCEVNAAKRLMPIVKKMHPKLRLIRVGDSLYATTPFIRETLDQGDHFIFTAKTGDHKSLFKHLKDREYIRHDEIDNKGRKFIYEWCHDVPLTEGSDAINVNVMCLRISTPQEDGTQKVSYIGTWITDLGIHKDNIVKLVRGARCRWRIENECFNTLKNHGYNIEHNYGHGESNLCFNFYILTLLAFYIYQILSLCDILFQKVRKNCGTLKETWMQIRIAFNWFVYESWEAMLDHILNQG